MKNGFRGILFDLDGTIADSIDFFYGLTCEVLTAIGVPLPSRVEVLRAIGMGIAPTSHFLPPDFPDKDVFLRRLYAERWEEWTRRYGVEIQPLPGACEAIEAVHRRGFRIGLVTSSSGDLPFLDRWGIRGLFSVIVNREAVRRIKPDPEPLLMALSALGVDAAEVASVGDSPLDARAGRAAGVETIGVLTGAGTESELRMEGVRIVLPSVVDLPPLLSGQLGER